MFRTQSNFIDSFIIAICLTVVFQDSVRTLNVQHNSLDCVGPIFRVDNNGVIVSHRGFGKTAYLNRFECNWEILAPFNSRIMVQFGSVASLEQDANCKFDRVKLWEYTTADGGEQRIRNERVLCGSFAHVRYVSEGNRIRIKFTSDIALAKDGFQLRYRFFSRSSTIDSTSSSPVTAKSSQGRSIPLSSINRPCHSWEYTCQTPISDPFEDFGPDSVCIAKDWVCDRIADCGESLATSPDEKKCPTPIPGNSIQCHTPSQFACDNGKQCVPKRFWCDSVGKTNANDQDFPNPDCTDGSDETKCSDQTHSTPLPITTTQRPPVNNHTHAPCSVQAIQPIEDDTQIVGGKPAKPNSWPWMASLWMAGRHICGATLLNKRWVLSAAHCFTFSQKAQNFRVDLGRHLIRRSEPNIQQFSVKQIRLHPQYRSETDENDFALVELDRSVQLNRFVQPVCLPHSDETDAPVAGTKCKILGWGATKGTGGEGILKQATVPIVSRRKCDRLYDDFTDLAANQNDVHGQRFDFIKRSMICAGYMRGGTDACQGDSGGPLLCRRKDENNEIWHLYGVTSWGDGCAKRRRPGVYGNVAFVADWIKSTIDGS